MYCSRIFLPERSLMGEKKELVLTSVEELNEYLRENGDGETIVSIVLELTGTDKKEGSGQAQEGGVDNG